MAFIQSGLLLIDKPEGPSSAHVVHRVKKIIGAKRVGHLGTLDPFASGLLPIGVNEGTKIADIFLGGAKSYRAVMVLGVATDSQDATGKIIDERPVPVLADDDLRRLEAILLLTDTNLQGAISLAEKLRSLVENHPSSNGHHMTISLGASEYRDPDTMATFVEQADAAMYQAKQGGRNQVGQ